MLQLRACPPHGFARGGAPHSPYSTPVSCQGQSKRSRGASPKGEAAQGSGRCKDSSHALHPVPSRQVLSQAFRKNKRGPATLARAALGAGDAGCSAS
eukprot:5901674-Alexandrium_andersonii.AAC.1